MEPRGIDKVYGAQRYGKGSQGALLKCRQYVNCLLQLDVQRHINMQQAKARVSEENGATRYNGATVRSTSHSDTVEGVRGFCRLLPTIRRAVTHEHATSESGGEQ